jgi:hypothetical protein
VVRTPQSDVSAARRAPGRRPPLLSRGPSWCAPTRTRGPRPS